MHAKIYDFTLTAGGVQRLPVVGDYFKLLSCTGNLEISCDTGAQLDLLAGQGLRDYGFHVLTIKDKSGSGNVGRVLVGYSSMVDDRVTGEVSVIDGGKSRTFSGAAFAWAGGNTATAGNFPVCQLQNPVGSGKNIVVKAISLNLSGAGTAYVSEKVNPDQTSFGAPTSSKLVGNGGSIALVRGGSVASLASPKFLDVRVFGAAGSFDRVLQEPIVLRPGFGIDMVSQLPASTLNWCSEWIEEPI